MAGWLAQINCVGRLIKAVLVVRRGLKMKEDQIREAIEKVNKNHAQMLKKLAEGPEDEVQKKTPPDKDAVKTKV